MSASFATTVSPGWYVILGGHSVDLRDWEDTLSKPFDPVVIRGPDGDFLLGSADFQSQADAIDVRERGRALIARLNGAMALMHGSEPIELKGVVRFDAEGRKHITIFAEGMNLSLRGCSMRATVTIHGPDGKPLPPPPPRPSLPQLWNVSATENDDIADLLEQHGKATGWYEIYKTIEIAEVIVGGKHKLEAMLGEAKANFSNMRRTANFYRHARAIRPDVPTTLADAKPLLNFAVRTVLDVKTAEYSA